MSQLKLSLLGLFALVALSACVTINVYFPAAAAEKAADKLIQEVWEKKQEEQEQQKSAPQTEETEATQSRLSAPLLFDKTVEILIPSAQAQADFNVSTPVIEALKMRMKKRFEVLEAYYEQGAIGLTHDALILLRDPSGVPLRQRNKINTEVDNENQDRLALYQAIADANGHPEWVTQIRATFAQRWISNAKKGWWYQDAQGQWVQK